MAGKKSIVKPFKSVSSLAPVDGVEWLFIGIFVLFFNFKFIRELSLVRWERSTQLMFFSQHVSFFYFDFFPMIAFENADVYSSWYWLKTGELQGRHNLAKALEQYLPMNEEPSCGTGRKISSQQQ